MFKPNFAVEDLIKEAKEIKKPETIIKVRAQKTKKDKEYDVAVVVPTQSDFKSVRHLVEYMLVKNKDIRYDHVEKIVKKAFPAQAFDVGMFTWFKLEYVKNGKLMFREDIEKQLQA